MAFTSLTGRAISASYLNLVQYSGSNTIGTAGGNLLIDFTNYLTTSSIISTSISSSWTSSSISASYSLTSSYSLNSIEASPSASWASSSISSSYSLSASYAPSTAPSNVRTALSADTTYYVRTDGNDSNDGLSNNAGGAFLTIQKAIDTVASVDLKTYNVTIQIADGTYTSANILKSLITGGGICIIQGNNSSPGNVIINPTNASCFAYSSGTGKYMIKDLKMQTTTGGNCITATDGVVVYIHNVIFGTSAGGYYHMHSVTNANILASGSYFIQGGAGQHMRAELGGIVYVVAKSVQISGSLSITQFAYAYGTGLIYCQANTYGITGSVTGQRYYSEANSVIYTNNGGANYLPGNSAGATANGGLYL